MSRYGSRIAALARRAERDRAAFDPRDCDTGIDRYLRDGAGQAIWLYLESRTGGRLVPFEPPEYHALEAAMNTWLELYAACNGVEMDIDITLRSAAEAMLDTRNVIDTAEILTQVAPDTGAQ